MSYKKRYTKNSKKPSKKDYKKSYKPNMGKLMDKKVNTLLEKRMQEIARREDRLMNPSLCLRRFCWVDYDPLTNKFAPLQTAQSNSFDWDGQLVNLTDKIIKEDAATNPNPNAGGIGNNLVVDDPLTHVLENVDRAADGPNIITTVVSADGRRTSDVIYVTGFSLNHRIICDFTDLAEENEYDKIDIHIGLVKIRRTYTDAQNLVPTVYTPKNLLRILPWGYNSSLDKPQVEKEIMTYRPKILFRDKITITNGSDKHNNIIFKNYGGSFDPPIKIDYQARDFNARSANYDIYLVVRSTVASTGETEDTQSKPYVQTCAKLYYKNNQ